RSIFRKGQVSETSKAGAQPPVQVETAQELALARHLLNFGFVLGMVAEDYRPNLLCNYLYELAGHFMVFFENCPVLKSPSAKRASRLVLCELTARVLSQGLGVLGIEVIEQM
ncbi:MAG: DALR anticodon-binding domain-containing protein, partial [Limisphaerales bacterium]